MASHSTKPDGGLPSRSTRVAGTTTGAVRARIGGGKSQRRRRRGVHCGAIHLISKIDAKNA